MKVFWKKGQEDGRSKINDKTDRARGLGRKTGVEVGERNQMTALRCQTGGKNIRHPFFPSGGQVKEEPQPRCILARKCKKKKRENSNSKTSFKRIVV